MAKRQSGALVRWKHFCLNTDPQFLRQNRVFEGFVAECRRADFPLLGGEVAGLAARPIPALPRQSLCSTPQRKCPVWPREGAQSSQDKEIFRLSPLPSPPPPFSPLITMIGVHFPCRKMQGNASER